VSEFHTVRETIAITQSTYIIIVTRGHRSDEDVLAQVATSDARYIGMIGSKRKVLTTYEHLVERGIPPEALQRVHAPMGVEIGAVTPEEIGISVVAQLIRIRRGEMAPLRNKSDIMDDVVRNLAAKPHGRNA
jgi:xanthine dehydrogenase accessory factor